MKVFLSWSGESSRQYASLLNSWLPQVIQAVEPYFSPDDVDKGSRWFNEISKELEETSVGIICLTNTNLNAPWLMFEAGALAKGVEKSRVIPMLFGVKPTDLQGPLVQFQATTFNKKNVRDLIELINRIQEGNPLKPQVLELTFEKFWPELDEKVREIMNSDDSEHEAVHRPDRELLEEILVNSRALVYGPGDDMDPITIRPIAELGLPARILKCLNEESVYYTGDLLQLTESQLLKHPNFSTRDVRKIKDVLGARGLAINLLLEGWPPKELIHDVRLLFNNHCSFRELKSGPKSRP